MKFQLYYLFIALIISSVIKAQVGIGTLTPDASAELHIYSTDKGFLPPVMTNEERDAILLPAEGLMVYCYDCSTVGYYLYSNNNWLSIMNTDNQSISRSGLTVTLENGGSFQDSVLSEVQVDNYVSNNGYLTNQIDIDETLNADSDNNISSQKAVKSYIDNSTTGLNETSLGFSNYHFGLENMGSVTSLAYYNMALGYRSLNALTSGGNNTALGYASLGKLTTGLNNVAIGDSAMFSVITGNNNVAFGFNAGKNNLGSSNTIIGYQTGENSTGSGSTFLGSRAGYNAQSSYSVFVGYQAGYNENNDNRLYIETSTSSTPLIGGSFDGRRVGINTPIANLSSGATLQVEGSISLEEGSAVNGFSTDALLSSNSDGLVPTQKAVKTYIDDATGYLLPSSTDVTLSGGNSSVPTEAAVKTYVDDILSTGGVVIEGSNFHFDTNNMTALTSNAFSNMAIGDGSLLDLTGGDYNIGIGPNSLASTTNGRFNTGVGSGVLYDNLTGDYNVALGNNAGRKIVGDDNVIIGVNAGYNTTGSENVFVGKSAGFNSQSEGSVFIGYNAGYNEDKDDVLYIENSSSSTPLIGGSFSSRVVTINADISTSGGFDFDVHAANKNYNLFVGGGAYKSTGGSTWNHSSDKRLKTNIEYMQTDEMLCKVLQMKGVSYVWNDTLTGLERDEGIQYGFIAQDLQKVWPEKISEGPFGYLTTSYGTYDAMFVESIRALHDKTIRLKKENEEIIAEIVITDKEKDQEIKRINTRLDKLEVLIKQGK